MFLFIICMIDKNDSDVLTDSDLTDMQIRIVDKIAKNPDADWIEIASRADVPPAYPPRIARKYRGYIIARASELGKGLAPEDVIDRRHVSECDCDCSEE